MMVSGMNLTEIAGGAGSHHFLISELPQFTQFFHPKFSSIAQNQH